jgi:hypothetical protein
VFGASSRGRHEEARESNQGLRKLKRKSGVGAAETGESVALSKDQKTRGMGQPAGLKRLEFIVRAKGQLSQAVL